MVPTLIFGARRCYVRDFAAEARAEADAMRFAAQNGVSLSVPAEVSWTALPARGVSHLQMLAAHVLDHDEVIAMATMPIEMAAPTTRAIAEPSPTTRSGRRVLM